MDKADRGHFKEGSTEVWEILNLTGDTHPIHIHLVNAAGPLPPAVRRGQPTPGGAPTLDGQGHGPRRQRLGWKETVRMNPGEVTPGSFMKFERARPFRSLSRPARGSSRKGTGSHGAEYVWHCHILEHEEHDMMRPPRGHRVRGPKSH